MRRAPAGPLLARGRGQRLGVLRDVERWAKADLEARTAAWRVPRAGVAAMRFGGLAHDREAESRAGQLARLLGAVEALEDVPSSSCSKPGPWSRTLSTPSRRRDLDGAAGRAPLARVVEQVRDGAADPLGFAADDRRLQRRARSAARRAGACARRRRRRSRRGARRRLGRRARSARELDDVADERGQLVELVDDVRAQARAARLAAGARRPRASGCSRAARRSACAARGSRRRRAGAARRPSARARRASC